MKLNNEDPYPSILELVPDALMAVIPAKLFVEIAERYQTLGVKYQTEQQHADGRYINNMMFTSRIDNCREEVVDAAFCMLGWIFKARARNRPIPNNAYTILTGLIQIYGLLVAEKEIDEVA